ncbi:MAG: glycosyltransferase [Defluviitaleaceae bacterium]|nr:glycosyltransferase [Defluviitaleaceae bacterium]MCL2238332.1 glycosyltransferase [Defluviitaleaceae bacterium]
MNGHPLVSVIMPTYNAGKTIKDSIQSVLSQSYTYFELIIIDDCSTDNTNEIIHMFTDPRIHYICNEKNSGVATSRNVGIKIATGEWIAFLDSDDIWDADKLTLQLSFANKVNAKISYTASFFMNFEGRRYNWVMPAVYKLNYKALLRRNLISCSSVLIKRELMSKHLFPTKPKTHEDYVAWLKIVREVGVAYGLDEPLLRYRLSKISKSSSRLKSAIMTYNAYRESGFNLFLATMLTIRYAKYSIMKRHKILRGV